MARALILPPSVPLSEPGPFPHHPQVLQQVWRQDGGARPLCAHHSNLCAICCRSGLHVVQQVSVDGERV